MYMYSRIILVLTIAIGFASCATYRSGTTPDDVYYSPERERSEYYDFREEESSSSTEDYRLRQQIRDARLRNLDDDFFWTNRSNWYVGNSWINGPIWGNGWHGIGGFPVTPFNTWNQPFFCIPGTNFVVATPGKGNAITTRPRYTPSISILSNNQPRNTGTNSNGKFGTRSSGNGSRFFGGATNQSGNSYRFNIPSGGSGNYNNGSSGGGGSRTFGSGSSSSGRSSSGSSGTRTRRN
jgi:hypothetical protein